MGFPQNSTGLSFAGVLKWIFLITGAVCLLKAYQGLIQHEGATGGGRSVGHYLAGREAIGWGWQNLGLASLSFVIAWALWFFWQRNED